MEKMLACVVILVAMWGHLIIGFFFGFFSGGGCKWNIHWFFRVAFWLMLVVVVEMVVPMKYLKRIELAEYIIFIFAYVNGLMMSWSKHAPEYKKILEKE